MKNLKRYNPEDAHRQLTNRVELLEKKKTSAVYTDDQILESDTTFVTFEGFPQDRTILEVTYNCWLPDATGAVIMYVMFGDPGDGIDIPNPVYWTIAGTDIPAMDSYSGGSGGDGFGDATSAAGGGVGLWLDGEGSGPTWGRLRCPDYNRDADHPTGYGQKYLGEGAGGVNGTEASPKVWQAAGVSVNVTPLDKITFKAVSGADHTALFNFGAGSRFTLTAY